MADHGSPSISGARVGRELDAVMRLYGKPGMIVSDNGTELTSRAMLEWQSEPRRVCRRFQLLRGWGPWRRRRV